jgi:hypothetical protein
MSKINAWFYLNRRRLHILAIGCMAFLVGITTIYAAIVNSITPSTALYQGRYAFQSEEDYAAFKTLLTDGNITLRAFTELSSAYPVLVEYEVKAPLSFDFPYSKPIQTWGKEVNVAKDKAMIGVGLLGIVAGLGFTLKFFNKLG